MSDVPGSTMLLACLLTERWARRAPSWRRELVLGLCIGLSAYIRSMLILLVPAIALSRLLTARGRAEGLSWPSFCARRVLPFATVALLILAPWSIRNGLHPPPSPAEQTVLYSYGVALLHVDPADPNSPLRSPAAILERLPLRSRQLASVLGSRMRNEHRGNFEPRDELNPVDAVLALCFVGSSLVVLWRRREPAEIFVLGSRGSS